MAVNPQEDVRRRDSGCAVRKAALLAAALLVVTLVSVAGCAPAAGLDAHLRSIVSPHRFSVAAWQVRAIPGEIRQAVASTEQGAEDGVTSVREYFDLAEQVGALKSRLAAGGEADSGALQKELDRLQGRKAALAVTVERTIERQIRDTLAELGVFNPAGGLRVSFPPVNFRLDRPPNLLVVSPRDRIESVREITLHPGLTRGEIEDIESHADGLGVSSLVVGLGGLGATYPTFVADDASLRSVIETAVHEWLHQYLAFKPLGFLYLLDVTGLRRDYDIAVMNETIASMVGKEVGAIIYGKYYGVVVGGDGRKLAPAPVFDFDREMREIRRTVDSYLASGEIERAEQFMEDRRRYLTTMGYSLRKLNQAYFAFYDAYADAPGSTNPIGAEMKTLRARSGSVKEFLDTAAAMTSRQQLRESVE